ncbi:MAG: hypothetical protein HUJ90_00080, partial [Bacteroidales bacterium]|nr:hypothetical protein [Bacteroidales bacterium]
MKKIRPYFTIASAIAAILLVALGVIDYQKVVHLTDFTGGQNILAASVSFALLCIIFSAAVIKGRVQPKKVLSAASSRALWFVGIFAISILVGMLFS